MIKIKITFILICFFLIKTKIVADMRLLINYVNIEFFILFIYVFFR